MPGRDRRTRPGGRSPLATLSPRRGRAGRRIVVDVPWSHLRPGGPGRGAGARRASPLERGQPRGSRPIQVPRAWTAPPFSSCPSTSCAPSRTRTTACTRARNARPDRRAHRLPRRERSQSSPAAEGRLVARGVLCLPDFVSELLAASSAARWRIRAHRRRMRIAIVRGAVALAPGSPHVLDEAARAARRPRGRSRPELALRRCRAIRQRAARPSWLGRLFEAGLESYSRGWVPRAVVSALSPMYFRRILA